MSLHDTTLCDIACYGSFGAKERKALVSAIGDVEVDLISRRPPRYWACYLLTRGTTRTFFVSCSELPGVLRAQTFQAMLDLIDKQKTVLRYGRCSAKT